MQGMKLLVAVMTVLIVAGLGLLGYGMSKRAGEIGKPVATGAPIESLPLPPLARIDHMSGGPEGAALYIESPSGDYLYFVTPTSWSRIRVKREENQ